MGAPPRLRQLRGGAIGPSNFARARRHTRTVKFLRRVLPRLRRGHRRPLRRQTCCRPIGWVTALPKIKIPQIIPDKLTMDNPHYEGYNRDGGKYVVTAKTAVQDLTDTDHVKLNEITGDLIDVNKVKTNLKAAHGLYNYQDGRARDVRRHRHRVGERHARQALARDRVHQAERHHIEGAGGGVRCPPERSGPRR